MSRARGIQIGGVAVLLVAAGGVCAQSPSPALPPQNMPALSPEPTQRSVPPGPTTGAGAATQMRVPAISPLDGHVPPPNAPQPQLQHAEDVKTEPQREGVTGLRPDVFGFLGPYRRPTVPPLFEGNAARLDGLIRDGKLYLTLQDAIALALENNLDVEAERYNLTLARTDVTRAAGGGNSTV
jgi:outer membrane protein